MQEVDVHAVNADFHCVVAQLVQIILLQIDLEVPSCLRQQAEGAIVHIHNASCRNEMVGCIGPLLIEVSHALHENEKLLRKQLHANLSQQHSLPAAVGGAERNVANAVMLLIGDVRNMEVGLFFVPAFGVVATCTGASG